MSRQRFLDLAARRHRVPIATDLVVRTHDEAERVLLDGWRLGPVLEQAAHEFRTPLAFGMLDLQLEKLGLLRRCGVHDAGKRPSTTVTALARSSTPARRKMVPLDDASARYST